MPQTGDIGPPLFAIYINNIDVGTEMHNKIMLFVDDKKVFSQTYGDLQFSLNKLYGLNTRKLKLAPNKSPFFNILALK